MAFLQSIFLARIFGADVFGIFSFAIALISIVEIIITLGLDQLLMRELAQRGLDGALQSATLRTLQNLILRFIIPSVLVLTLGGLFLVPLFGAQNPYTGPLLAVSATCGFLVCRKFSEAIALGLKQQSRSIIASKIVFPATMILGAAAIAAFGMNRSLAAVSWLYAIAIVLSAFISVLLIRQAFVQRRQTLPSKETLNTRDVLFPALNLAFVMSANLIMNNVDTILLAPLAGPEDTAFARVAQRLAEATMMVQMIAMLHFKPLIAEAYKQNATDTLKAHLKTITLVLGIFGTLAFVIVMLFATPLALVFGEEFRASSIIIRSYAIGAYAMILAGPGMVLLTMTSKEAVASRLMWIALALNIALDLAFIPLWGGLGAGIATTLSQIFLSAAMLRACRRHLNLDASILSYLFTRARR